METTMTPSQWIHRLKPVLASGVAGLAALTLAASMPAHADTFPDGPVRIVVGSSPGGSTDAMARLIATALSKKWGQSVIVENRDGAMNTIATEFVARSKPDGKTLLMASPQHTQAPSQMTLKYDAVKSFAPISMTTTYPTYLVVNTDKVAAKSVAELLAYAKANPGKLNYGTAGKGSGQYRNFQILIKRAGIKMQEITYTGDSPAMVALAGGEIDLTFTPLSGIKGAADPAKLRVLGVTSAERSPSLPDVPPIADGGLPGFDEFDWHGLLAPAGTPREVVKKIRDDVAEAMKDPTMAASIAALGLNARASTPEEFTAFVAADVPKWTAFFQELKNTK
jgi:tripartite-type tricarboxylate transporter receptor subunit TctC